MKPITNLLLIIALICYTFLEFYTIPLNPTPLTGFRYTAGNITANFSLIKTLFVLVPYVAGFVAITFNCLKNRWWGIVSALFLLIFVAFFYKTGNYHDMTLLHEPDIVTSTNLGEGFPIEGLGAGYHISFALVVLALISAIISMMPFKFNQRLEQLIDNQVEHGLEEGKKHISHIGSKMKGEWSEIENRRNRKNKEHLSEAKADDLQKVAEQQEVPEKDEKAAEPDHSAYMPK